MDLTKINTGRYPAYTHGQILRHKHFKNTHFYYVDTTPRTSGKELICHFQNEDEAFKTITLQFEEVEPHPDFPLLEIIPPISEKLGSILNKG